MTNGCGGEGGYDFTKLRDKLKKLPGVNPDKLDKLYYDIEIKACKPHDDKFKKGGGIIAFLKANKEFAVDVIHSLQWTTIVGRLLIFLALFFGTSTAGIRYFNWTRII